MNAIIKIGLCFLIALLIGYIAYLQSSIAFNEFAGGTLIQILGTLFAINIGIIPVLYYEIRRIEKELGEDLIITTIKEEIKQNALVMTTLMIMSIFLTIIKNFMANCFWDYFISSFILGILFLIIIMLYDTVGGILNLDYNSKNQEK